MANELMALPEETSVDSISSVLQKEEMLKDPKSLTKLLNHLGRWRAASVCVRVLEWAKTAGVALNVYHYRYVCIATDVHHMFTKFHLVFTKCPQNVHRIPIKCPPNVHY
jgi:hypothetical protein